jgi:haloalkane dehalogenase
MICLDALSDDVVAAYEAPFPTPESKASMRGLVMSVPRADDKSTIALSEAWFRAFRRDTRPMLVIWAEGDLFLTLASGRRLVAKIGRDIDHVIPRAGHALQEDQGPLIGKLIAEWLPAVTAA